MSPGFSVVVASDEKTRDMVEDGCPGASIVALQCFISQTGW